MTDFDTMRREAQGAIDASEREVTDLLLAALVECMGDADDPIRRVLAAREQLLAARELYEQAITDELARRAAR